jgi:hypothetical protein
MFLQLLVPLASGNAGKDECSFQMAKLWFTPESLMVNASWIKHRD